MNLIVGLIVKIYVTTRSGMLNLIEGAMGKFSVKSYLNRAKVFGVMMLAILIAIIYSIFAG